MLFLFLIKLINEKSYAWYSSEFPVRLIPLKNTGKTVTGCMNYSSLFWEDMIDYRS